MSDLYKVLTEDSSDLSEAELHSANEEMFNVKMRGDEDHDGSFVSWKGIDEDLKRMRCGGMTLKSIPENQGNFLVQTWDRSEYACRIHTMHVAATRVLPAEHCIRFVNSDMSRPTTIFINEPGIEWGLSQKSARREWQHKAFKVCSDHLVILNSGKNPGIPKRPLWRHNLADRLGRKLVGGGIKVMMGSGIG